jgi:hypothetical protein
MFDATLAGKLEMDCRPIDVDVFITHGRQSIGVIVTGVFFVADADVCGLHEPNDGCENFFARHPGMCQVPLYVLANTGENRPEEQHALVLRFITNFAPPGVVAALLATTGISSCSLEVAVGDRADPDVVPCGWDGERLNTGNGLLIADGAALDIYITE